MADGYDESKGHVERKDQEINRYEHTHSSPVYNRVTHNHNRLVLV